VLVDTPVWSEFFRRHAPDGTIQGGLKVLIEDGEALMLGPVRQEILSGISEERKCEQLCKALGGFPDIMVLKSDYEDAARMYNHCRRHGIQGSNTDFLICAVSARLNAPIFTLDKDFEKFAKQLPVSLYSV